MTLSYTSRDAGVNSGGMTQERKRLFVALSLDPDRQLDLMAALKKLRQGADRSETSVKWSPPSNWHVTLAFLGETPIERISDLTACLQSVARDQNQFQIDCHGIGAFPEPRRARVIWAGISRSQELLDLQTAIEAAFAPFSLQLTDEMARNESRDFVPHVTLGRLRSAGSVSDLISPFVRKRFDAIAVRELTLFESVQRGAFPEYLPLARAPFPGD